MTMNFESNEALSVEASPDGKYIFAGSSTSKIYAFDTASGEMKARLSGHQWEVQSRCLSSSSSSSFFSNLQNRSGNWSCLMCLRVFLFLRLEVMITRSIYGPSIIPSDLSNH